MNSEEEKKFQEIVLREKHKSESAIIRERIFRRRDRYRVKLDVVDIKFLSILSTLISSTADNYSRGQRIQEDLAEMKEIVDKRLNEV